MAYITGTGSNACDLLEAINTLLTTTLSSSWSLKYSKNATYDGASRLAECIWCGNGDGNDKIYLQMRIPNTQDSGASTYTVSDHKKICLDGLAGYDTALEYYEQPGSIQLNLKSDGSALLAQPCLVMADESQFTYWIVANSQRIIIVLKLSTYYESAYLGFINPVASERQYPYPMYIAGNGVANGSDWSNNTNGSFVFPSAGSGYLRRADGAWRQFDAFGNASTTPDKYSVGTVFPYNCGNTNLIGNYTSNSTTTEDNMLLFPILLCTTSPYDINGVLDSVYYISAAEDISAEQTIVQDSTNYIIFDTKAYRGANTYFALKLA